MRRIRWSDPEESSEPSPAAWQHIALIAATLFLNFAFWMVPPGIPRSSTPLPHFVVIAAAASLLHAALFFALPAMALQPAGRPLIGVLEESLGAFPAWVVRVAAAWFLVVWISTLVAIPAWWFLPSILRRTVSPLESGVVAGLVLAYLVLTGLRGLQTSARLSAFTNKLAIAILLAALIRVRTGLPAVLQNWTGVDFKLWGATQELWVVPCYAAPLTFLAAGLPGLPHRKQILKAAGMGIALPLFGTLLLTEVIADATYPAGYGQPSLEPSVAMALWQKAAGSALPPRMILTAITLFGVLRFCVRVLAGIAFVPALGKRLGWLPFGCLLAAVGWAAPSGIFGLSSPAFELSMACLSSAAAVLSAGYVIGRHGAHAERNIDWVGVTAVLAGPAICFLMHRKPDPWWQASPLAAYAAAFVITVCGRRVQLRQRRRYRDST